MAGTQECARGCFRRRFEANERDRAIAEFNQALLSRPDNANTLFNLGLVTLQGKNDAASAIADWKKLLSVNPDYPGRQQVEQMIAQAESQSSRASR